jgi:hypothetical protein
VTDPAGIVIGAYSSGRLFQLGPTLIVFADLKNAIEQGKPYQTAQRPYNPISSCDVDNQRSKSGDGERPETSFPPFE